MTPTPYTEDTLVQQTTAERQRTPIALHCHTDLHRISIPMFIIMNP